jgi:hypothetical protein
MSNMVWFRTPTRLMLTMIALGVSWQALNSTAKDLATNQLTNVYMKALRDWAPNTGTYVNEVRFFFPSIFLL